MCELIFYNKWTITKLIETFQIKLETVGSIPEHPDTSFLNHFMMKNHNNKFLILTIPIFPKISWNQENLKHQNQILHITRKTDFSSSLLEWTSLLKTKKLFYGVGEIHHRLPKNCSMELEIHHRLPKIVLWNQRNSSWTSKNSKHDVLRLQ